VRADDTAPRYENRSGTLLARKVSVYDGDTFTILFVAEDGKAYRRRCRCLGYDSPEMRGKDANKAKATEARDYLDSILPTGVFSLDYEGLDKYGRLLVTFDVGRESLSDHMVRMGHGYPYDGGTKRKETTS
jgi:endonuclease YncB( thermonuclease family)